MDGWIILDKPVGPGSTQAVSAVKRALREGGYGKHKVGHGGTLDPLASGVLPVALGEATKLAGRMLDSDKIYEFTVAFGAETDTLDLEGAVTVRSDIHPSRGSVAAVLPRFTGPIEQVPPAYSALKVDGKRAYDLARAGEAVALKRRSVTVHSLAFSSPSTTPLRVAVPLPLAGEDMSEATFVAHVSKGTYIRSLARDIAHALGTVGHVTMLRRTKAGPFTLEQAISLDLLAQAARARDLEQHLLPLRAGLDDIPALPLDPGQAGMLRKGQVPTGAAADDGLHFATLDDVPVALVEVRAGVIRVVRGFNL